MQSQWRYEKRAEVLAEVYRHLSKVQTTAGLATRPGASLETRQQRILQNRKALEELTYYLHAHTLWLDSRTLPTIKDFVEGLPQRSNTMKQRSTRAPLIASWPSEPPNTSSGSFQRRSRC